MSSSCGDDDEMIKLNLACERARESKSLAVGRNANQCLIAARVGFQFRAKYACEHRSNNGMFSRESALYLVNKRQLQIPTS